MSDWGAVCRSLAMEASPKKWRRKEPCIIPSRGESCLRCPHIAPPRAVGPAYVLLTKAGAGEGLGPQQERHRAVIGQAHHHMGTEAAGFHPWRVRKAAFFEQSVEDPFSLGRGHGGAEPRAHARGGVGGEGELAHQ